MFFCCFSLRQVIFFFFQFNLSVVKKLHLNPTLLQYPDRMKRPLRDPGVLEAAKIFQGTVECLQTWLKAVQAAVCQPFLPVCSPSDTDQRLLFSSLPNSGSKSYNHTSRSQPSHVHAHTSHPGTDRCGQSFPLAIE